MASLVQHRAVAFASSTAPTAAFSSPVTIGNRVIVGVALFPSTVTVSSVTDNGTTPNSYNDDNTNLTNGTVGDTLNTRSANVAANPGAGNLTVTANLSGTASGVIFIHEVSGCSAALNAVDTSGTTTDTTGTATALSATSASSAAAPGEYVFGVFGVSGNPGSWAAGSNTTLDDGDVSNGSASCHRTNQSQGTGQETVNLSIGGGNSYLGQVTLYQLAPAGSAAPPEGRRPATLRQFRMVHRRRATTWDVAIPDVPVQNPITYSYGPN